MMGIIIALIVLLILTIFGLLGYVLYRSGLRYAKGIERGIKMVPILINLPPASEDIEVGGRDVRDVMEERISQAEVLYNVISSTATRGFKSKFFGQRHIGFEIVAIDGVIRFYAAAPVAMTAVIKQAVLTAYPGAQLEEVEDHNIFSEAGKISGTYGGEVGLKKQFAYPIATFNKLKRDAVSGMINALKSLEHGDGATIQILLRPANESWTKNSESLAKKLRDDKGSGFSLKELLAAPFKTPSNDGGESKAPKQLSNLEQSTIDAVEEKTRSSGYEVLIRVIASSSTASKSQAITNNIVSAFSLFDAPGLNGFKFEPAKNIERFVTDFIFRFFPPEKNKMILNATELATLFHFPDDQFTKTSQVQRQQSKQVEGPGSVSESGLLIGHNVHHGVKKEIRLSDDDRRRHVYIVGQTGTGKSVLLENMMVQDMRAGKGFAFIDPHGDAAEELLGMIPKERSEDVIYFDPGGTSHPPGLNIFEYRTEDQKDFLIQEAINMLEKLYDPHQQGIVGPKYHHMFRNAALAIMADPGGGTFVDIPKLFTDPQFVKQKLKHVTDKAVQEFWTKEFPNSQRSNDAGEINSWFVSKFGAFLSNQMMRNIIGQTKSSFDLRDVMDNRKILIANLSKGRLGELNSKLLGMIFVMKFQAAAMSRASIHEDERVDFSLYVDEFQNFSTEAFAFILSEARKYRLNLIVANQFISQLSEEVREAVFGNVGTIISFRTGPNDADFLVKQFEPVFNDRDLVNMPNYNTAVRLMNKGIPSQPFNLKTLPPFGTANPRLAEALKQLSALKYGRSRQEVEEEIFNRISTKPAPSPFDSLANTQGEGRKPAGQTSPASGQPPGGGSPSFLDEWLAKRRQAMQSRPTAQRQGQGAPAVPGQPPSQASLPPRPTPASPPPASQAVQPNHPGPFGPPTARPDMTVAPPADTSTLPDSPPSSAVHSPMSPNRTASGQPADAADIQHVKQAPAVQEASNDESATSPPNVPEHSSVASSDHSENTQVSDGGSGEAGTNEAPMHEPAHQSSAESLPVTEGAVLPPDASESPKTAVKESSAPEEESEKSDDQAAASESVTHGHNTPPSEDPSEETASDASDDTEASDEQPNPAPVVSDPKIGNLQPGEIYIDEDGGVHHG